MSEEHAADAAPQSGEVAATVTPLPEAVPVATEPATPAEPTAPAAPEITPHTEEPGVLSAQPEVPAEPAKSDAEPAVPDAAAPVDYELPVPEGYQVPPERLDELRGILREASIAPEVGGKLWGMHTQAMEELAHNTLQGQHDAFATMRRGWRDEIMSSPDLGGSGYDTNKATANRMLQKFVPPDRREAFDNMLRTTGVTDHPEMFRFLLNLARWADEPQSAPPPSPSPLRPRDAMGARPRGGTAADRVGGSRFEYEHSRAPRR